MLPPRAISATSDVTGLCFNGGDANAPLMPIIGSSPTWRPSFVHFDLPRSMMARATSILRGTTRWAPRSATEGMLSGGSRRTRVPGKASAAAS